MADTKVFKGPGDLPESAAISVQPIWIRPPVNGSACPYSGLGHSMFYKLLNRAGRKIKQVSLKPAGANRGTRLVWWPSLAAYLHELAEQQDLQASESNIKSGASL